MGKHLTDEEIDHLFEKVIERKPDTIEVYRKVLSNDAWDVIEENQVLSYERGLVAGKLEFYFKKEKEVGCITADMQLFDDVLRRIGCTCEDVRLHF